MTEHVTAALLVAAPRGPGSGGDAESPWQLLRDRRVADWTVKAFRSAADIDRIVLVLPAEDLHRAASFPDAIAVTGGASRAASVRLGLHALEGAGVTRVLIHDLARPLVSQQTISDVLGAVSDTSGAVPALESIDALWPGEAAMISGTAPAPGLYRVQTPAGFPLAPIRAAYRAELPRGADDLDAARRAGLPVAMVPGDARNIKLVRAADFARAEAYMGTTMDIRIGNGYDVHAFGPGDHVVLCGVKLPHDKALAGHSDADVGMHAVTDAIYGALALGDIGRHFPPSDPQWKGAASDIFLRDAVGHADRMGYALGNIDLTLICETPKIGPHAAEMVEAMSWIMQIDPERISIKATTSERLGFTGRQEGIAAQATALLIKR